MYMFYQHVVTMNPSACDSGNLEAAIELGAYAGLQLAWVPVWSAVLGFCLQDLASRIGLASGQDLAQLVREHYPRWCVRSLYICLELAVVAADIQEVRESTQSLSRHHNQTRLRLTKSVCLHGQVIGTAIALNLLLGLPLWMGSLFTAVLSMVLVFLHDSHSTLFEALIAVALCVTSMCAIGMMLFGGVDSGALLTGLIIPSAPPETALIVVGTIGATVMPHNIFLGSRLLLDKRTMSDAEECGTKSEDHEQAPTNQPKVVGVRAAPRSWHRIINFSRCELAFALVVSLFCNAGLISTFSRAAYSPTCLGGDEPLGCIANGVSTPGDGGDACVIQQINVAGQCGTIDLQNAGGSLEASMPPELGAGAKVLWAVALYSAGQASTLTCTCAGQVIMDGMLQLKVVPWMRALITRMVALGPALAIVLYASSADAKFDLIQAVCEGANVLQATVLPFALLPALRFSSDTALVGEFALGRYTRTFAWLATIGIVASSILIAVDYVQGMEMPGLWVAFVPTLSAYLALCTRLAWSDLVMCCRFRG